MMTYLNILKSRITKYIKHPLDAPNAYDLWASEYDKDNDNLVFELEKEILDTILENADLNKKKILDYGCGTGRNWNLFLSLGADKIVGCDVSVKMLSKLKMKYPGAELHFINDPANPELPLQPDSFDLIFSTLVLAHLKNINKIFELWEKLLQSGGEIILTDLHPMVLRSGGKRTFNLQNKTFEVKNYIHPIDEIKNICGIHKLKILDLKEKIINESVKDFYKRKNAVHIYNKFKGLPLVYGMRIGK